MKLSTTSPLLLLLFLTIAMATPIIQRRDLGGVLICNGPNATGSCDYAVYEFETCYDMPPAFRGNVATFAPDGEGFYCYPYAMKCAGTCQSPQGCTAGAVSFFSPHKFDFGRIGWANYIESFNCFKNETAAASRETRKNKFIRINEK